MLFEKMERAIQKGLSKNPEKKFMEIKHQVLSQFGLHGEERDFYSSLLSKSFGAKGGKAKAKKIKQKKMLSEVSLERAISEAKELENEDAIRAGNLSAEY